MTPKEYIISKLNSFIHEFPQTRVRYEYDVLSDTHFIEVVPNQVYHLNDDYIQWEGDMFDDFIELFPNDNLGFMSDDAIVGLENIDYELRGLLYDIPYSTEQVSIIVHEKDIEIFNITQSESYNIVTYTKDICSDNTLNNTNSMPAFTKLSILPKAS